MLKKATVLTALFTIVDDTMKGPDMKQDALKGPGSAPHLSDSEVITIALYQELIGEPREDHGYQLHQASLRPFFLGLNEHSRYQRRKRNLWAVNLAVRVNFQLVLEALEPEETAAIDSAPVPCVSYKRSKESSDFVGRADYGVCSCKAMKYFGCKLHRVVSLTYLIMGFLLTLACYYDNQTMVELLDSFSHPLKRLLGDGAYNGTALQSHLQQNRSLQLLAPAKPTRPKTLAVGSKADQPLAFVQRNDQCKEATSTCICPSTTPRVSGA